MVTNFAYNLSENLRKFLVKTENLKKEILLIPLSPKNELKAQWEANMERIKWSISFTDNPLAKTDIAELLSQPLKKRLALNQKDVISQKDAFCYLKENWLVTKNPVNLATVIKLYQISCQPTLGRTAGLTELSEKAVSRFLEYLQNSSESPVIHAGIAQIQLLDANLFEKGNSRVARLLSYLFLYKSGYDFRQLLVLDEYFRRDLTTYRKIMDASFKSKNLTLWLEYFSYSLSVQLEKALGKIKSLSFQTELPASFWKLNDRHREIIGYLEQPGLRITNKNVQKMFGVSQITASRDLTKLSNLGLLFPHGEGRSVFYTRV